ncbi:MAG: winged helix-turn-helix transcriptional regulator, partial [Candidatus Micrarchaeota archaeon]
DLIPGNSSVVEYDEYDLKLLAVLSANARIHLIVLAEKIGLSPTATKYRLKNLKKKGVILGFRPKINLAKIGYYWYKVEFQLEDYKAKEKLQAFCNQHPNIVYAYESIGGRTDFEIEMEVESHQMFREVVDLIRKKFKDSIRTYSYYLWSMEHKIVFFPSLEFFKKDNNLVFLGQSR